MKNNLKKVNVYLDEKKYKKIKNYVEKVNRRGYSAGSVIREMIETGLKKIEVKK
jgi:hypothetical protein